MKELVRRYPEVSPEEEEQITNFLRNGPMLDRALLSAVPELQQNLEQFEADHRGELSLGRLEYVVGIALLALMMVGAYLAWDIAL